MSTILHTYYDGVFCPHNLLQLIELFASLCRILYILCNWPNISSIPKTSYKDGLVSTIT